MLPWEWQLHQNGKGSDLTCSDGCRAFMGHPPKPTYG